MNATPIQTQNHAAAGAPSADGARLRKAAEQFESLFVNLLLKSMRTTVIESDLIENKGEIATYRSLLDEEMAKQMASGPGGLGIADMIVRSFEEPASTEGAEAAFRPVSEATRIRAQRAYGAVEGVAEPRASRLPRTSLLKKAEQAHPVAADTVRSYGRHIDDAAKSTGLDPELILAVIMSESSGRADARSGAGAQGLMQLMPGTAAELGVDDAFDPGQNIDGGSRYLAELNRRFDGDLDLTLAGYNAGPGRVREAGDRVPDIAETQNYVSKVKDLYRRLIGAQDSGSETR